MATSAGARAGAATNSRRGLLFTCLSVAQERVMCAFLPNELLCEPKEGFFKVIVRLGGDLEILQVLLAVEGNSAGLHFTFLSSIIKIKGLNQKKNFHYERRLPSHRFCCHKGQWECFHRRVRDRGAN